MKIEFRATGELIRALHADLSRRHAHAHERVAFLSCQPAALPDGGLLLLAQALHPVDDEDYEPSNEVGALLGGAAFRKALQYAYNNKASMFHVHRHEHRGHPRFSNIDLSESARFVPDFWKVRPLHPHGALVLSHDSCFGLVWTQRGIRPTPIHSFTLLEYPLRKIGRAVL